MVVVLVKFMIYDCGYNKELGNLKKQINSITETSSIWKKHPGTKKDDELVACLHTYNEIIKNLSVDQLIKYYKHSDHFKTIPYHSTIEIMYTKISQHPLICHNTTYYQSATIEIQLLFVKTALDFLWYKSVADMPRVHTKKCRQRIIAMCQFADVDHGIWLCEAETSF